MTGDLVRPAAVQLLSERLGSESRVLVLGGGGWFGSTVLALIAESSDQTTALGLTGQPRRLTVGPRTWALGGWDWDVVIAFAPSLVVNCAFLTRERVEQHGFERYVSENVVLTSRFSRTLALPSVRAAVTVSSGAAVVPDSSVPDIEVNPYGHLKWTEEILSRHVASSHGVSLVVCRTWSVSGPLVPRPLDYAFSNLVLQSAEDEIRIQAANEVWRRYVGVDDLLAVCISLALDGWSGDVDSGGPLVEIAELAQRVVDELRPGAPIKRPAPDGSPPNRYHSDDRSWNDACRRLGHTPAFLEEQIRTTANGLLDR